MGFRLTAPSRQETHSHLVCVLSVKVCLLLESRTLTGTQLDDDGLGVIYTSLSGGEKV